MEICRQEVGNISLFPCFERGTIITTEILESLRDYPRKYAEVISDSYSDGIISGLHVSGEKNKILIKKGIIKLKGRIYVIGSDKEIILNAVEGVYKLSIKITEEKDGGHLKYLWQYFLDGEIEMAGNSLEIGRFSLKNGAELRFQYTGFPDINTEYNTFNIINVKFSCRHEKGTMHPGITREFSDRMLKNRNLDAADTAFIFRCAENEAVPRELILKYLRIKTGKEIEDLSNHEIYKHLLKICKNENFEHKSIGTRERMIVD